MAAALIAVKSLMLPENVVVAPAPPTLNIVEEPAPTALPSTTLLVPEPLLAKEAIAGFKLVKYAVAVPEAGLSSSPPAGEVLFPSPEFDATVKVPLLSVVRPL
jgi:hypothetical protein